MSPEPRTAKPAPGPVEPPDLREQGLLLLMADQRFFDPFSVGAIRFGNPELREPLVRSLGRIGDERGLPALQTLLIEGRPEVRREAAFAMGLLGNPSSQRDLLAAAVDSDVETAVWAIASLADLGCDLDRVMAALASLPVGARWDRVGPYLFRFPAEQILGVAREGLESRNERIRTATVFALAHDPRPAALELLRQQLGDENLWARGWVARALGQIGDRSDLPRLRGLLSLPEAGPRIHALRAAHRLIASGLAPPPADWIPLLLEMFAERHPGVSLTAMEVSAAWLLDEALGDALVERLESGSARQREVALQSLAFGGDPRARDYVTRWATSSRKRDRVLAATMAGHLGDSEILQYSLLDPEAAVREAALASILEAGGESADGAALAALEDRDPGVRALVVQWLIDHPVAPADQLSRAIIGPGAREVVELRVFGARALAARGLAEPLERGLVVQNLESLARVGEYPARREASQALGKLDRPEPPLGPAASRRSTATYMQMVLQTDRAAQIEIETPYGILGVELSCSLARANCLNFLQLAEQKFFDGQVFHRVVPEFLVQAGDPRGDGWGGPGYTVRDELNRQPFERGIVGMASSGPDAAGSQFFITLSRQPQLDARYTALGKVVRGDEILDRLVQGDRLERVRVVR